MKDRQFIRTSNVAELAGAFNKIPRPWFWLTKAVSGVLDTMDELPLPGIPVGGNSVRRLSGVLFDGHRIRAAAWRWYNPEPPRLVLEQVPALMKKAGLSAMNVSEFADAVAEQGDEWRRRVPGLSRHIEARTAELEFLKSRQGYRSIKASEVGAFLIQSGWTNYLVAAEPVRAAAEAQVLLRRLLGPIAGGLAEVLRREAGSVNVGANLMVRVAVPENIPVGKVRHMLGDLGNRPSAKAAARLWSCTPALQFSHIFVVVADTSEADDQDGYRGFWIPDVRSKNEMIPGAPAAFHSRKPQAIFIDDVPLLPSSIQDVGALQSRWERYLQNSLEANAFVGRMFISIPVMSQAAPEDGGNESAVAVINVNVDGEDPWVRAYSPAWLRHAVESIQPLPNLAWEAFAAFLAARRENGTRVPALPRPMGVNYSALGSVAADRTDPAFALPVPEQGESE